MPHFFHALRGQVVTGSADHDEINLIVLVFDDFWMPASNITEEFFTAPFKLQIMLLKSLATSVYGL